MCHLIFNLYHAEHALMCYLLTGCLEDTVCEEWKDRMEYNYSLSEIECQEWDANNQAWVSGSCEVCLNVFNNILNMLSHTKFVHLISSNILLWS